MSSPIRPLPVEAAPQRTESDATINSNPDKIPGFGEVLDLHLEEKVEEKKEEPRPELEKKPNDLDGSAWAMLAMQLATTPAILQMPEAERGHCRPQEESAAEPTVKAPSMLSSAPVADQAQVDGLADKNVRAPSDNVESTAAKADLSSLVKKLGSVPEASQAVAPTAPPIIVAASTQNLAERGHSRPQERSTTDPSLEALLTTPGASVGDRASGNGLAEKNVRAPSTPVESPSPGLSSLVQKPAEVAEMQKLPPLPEAKPEEVAGKPPETGEKLRGIPVAKQAAVLNDSEKLDTSGSQEQQHGRFQVPQMEAASEQARVINRPMMKAGEHRVEFPADKTILDPANFTPSIRVETPNALSDTHRVTEVRAVAVMDAIRDQAWLLRASKANELNVVLRPDANTELVLQLRHVDGQVHLQARCERGDFTWLDSQWSAIQNTLAQQGVRVEPLQAASGTQDGGSNSMFMPDHRGSRQREERNFSFEQESSKTSRNSSRPVKTAARSRGWQSWA